MMGLRTSAAMVRTASKSPGELAANPASMTSTPSRSSCRAMSSFSAVVSPMPADCSPSAQRRVEDHYYVFGGHISPPGSLEPNRRYGRTSKSTT